MAKYDYNSYVNTQTKSATPTTTDRVKVGYFSSLKEDGDEAIVRFIYSSPSEFNIVSVHRVLVDGKYRNISCLRNNQYEPVDKCPLCASGNKLNMKFFVKLVEYTRDENGNVVATPKVWERPASFVKTLKDYFDEYGTLNDCVFKVKRHGAKGCLQTSYELIFANPAIYKPETYVKDFSAFEKLDLAHHSYFEKTFDEVVEYLETGVLPTNATATTNVAHTQAPTQTYVASQPVATAPTTYGAQSTPTQPARPSYGGVPFEETATATGGVDPTASRPRRIYNY